MLILLLALLAASPFAGTWQGTMNDQPAVKLTLEDAPGGKVTGTIVFYFQQRGDDGKWRVVEGGDAKGEILVPEVKGKVLTFEVRHHKSHGSAEYGPNKKFVVELTGPKEARFREAGGADLSGVVLTKQK